MTRFSHDGEDKRRFVRRIFSEIIPRYDFLNRLLTLGMDVRWRKSLAAALEVQSGDSVLDLACGTGAGARLIWRLHPGCRVIGADPVPGMLSRAQGKFPALAAVCCEAESLPFRDEYFRAVTVAFGVRNFSDLERGLQEIRRVLMPGGRFGILEFAQPDSGRLQGFYRWYLEKLLPRLGALFSRNDAYQYLPESIQHFPVPAEFVKLLGSIGFSEMGAERFLGGTVRVYYGRK